MSALGQALGGMPSFENNPYSQGAGVMGFPVLPNSSAQQNLQQLGVNFDPTQLQRNMLFGNNSGMARLHPRIASALEGMLLGLAGTPDAQGVEGAGGGFSRAAQGILGIPQARRNFQIAQIQAPMQMAQQVAGLRAAQEETKFRDAYIKYLGDIGASKQTAAQAAQDRINAQLESVKGSIVGQQTDNEGNLLIHRINPQTKQIETQYYPAPAGFSPESKYDRGQLYKGKYDLNTLGGRMDFLQDPKVTQSEKDLFMHVLGGYVQQKAGEKGKGPGRAGAGSGLSKADLQADREYRENLKGQAGRLTSALYSANTLPSQRAAIEAKIKEINTQLATTPQGGFFKKDNQINQSGPISLNVKPTGPQDVLTQTSIQQFRLAHPETTSGLSDEGVKALQALQGY